jgi:hypothetical protein
VKALLKGMAKIGWFTKVIGNIWIRKYQKWGLLHIHLFLIFPSEQKVSTTEDIDRLVLVKLFLPENAPLFETVTKCLLHEPCGQEYPNALCMVNDVCKKRYPRAFSKERRRKQLPYLLSTKWWLNVLKDSRWLCIWQLMGGAPQPLPYQDV